MRRGRDRASLPRVRATVLGAMIVMSCGGGAEPGPTAPDPRPGEIEPAGAGGSEPSAKESTSKPAEPAAGAAAPEPAEPDAGAAAPEPTEPDPLTFDATRSTSIGSPTHGRLEGGVALPLRAPGLLFLPRKDPGSRYGTVELVQGLVRAAAAMERAEAGAPVSIGDLSREAGGNIPSHASHRSGRDVDVLFFLRREADDEPFLPSKFIPLDPEGRGTDYGDLADPFDDVPVRIDLRRTWSFVAALLADESTDLQSILVVEHLRSLLLEEAERVGSPPELIQRFSEITCQPKLPHDDHMHIRVFCSADDIAAGCEDTPPVYPWRRRELAASGTKVVLAGKAPPDAEEEPRPKLKTIEQARAEAGPMHEDVVEFLDRRKAWASKPHPGRRWCR